MAEAKQRDAWNHTAQLSLLLANLARAMILASPNLELGDDAKSYTLADFHPYPLEQEQQAAKKTIVDHFLDQQ